MTDEPDDQAEPDLTPDERIEQRRAAFRGHRTHEPDDGENPVDIIRRARAAERNLR